MQFESLIQKDKYQVFLLTCPATLPFSFATHPWFYVNHKGVLFRVGISWKKKNAKQLLFEGHTCDTCVGHLHKDAQPPLRGCGIFPFSNSYAWQGKVLQSIEGDEGSVAARMVECIERSFADYPYSNSYALGGPNSNTYVQWVLNRFPEASMKLPWNAIGKGSL